MNAPSETAAAGPSPSRPSVPGSSVPGTREAAPNAGNFGTLAAGSTDSMPGAGLGSGSAARVGMPGTGPAARLDPMPAAAVTKWTRHAPWLAALAAWGAATWLVESATVGLLATGAALFAIVASAAQGRWRRACRAGHYGVGVLALALWYGPVPAGEFARAAMLLVATALMARAGAVAVSPSIAPLAGRIPWRFSNAYRKSALPFAVTGVLLGVGTALLAPTATLRVLGVAILPLFLRTYIGNLLSPAARRANWVYALLLHVALLGLFVDWYRIRAAAWCIVIAETVMFVAAALVVSRRTGVTPVPSALFALVSGAVLLLCMLSLPRTAEWPFLAAIGLGMAVGAVLFPRPARG